MTSTLVVSRPGSQARTLTMFTIGRCGGPRISIIAGSYSTRRHPPHAWLYPLSLLKRYRRAAPIPRVLLRVSLIVCRVPKETSVESVARISDAEMSAIAAARAASRVRPMVTSETAAGAAGCGSTRVAGGAEVEHDAAIRMPGTRKANVFLRMLCYLDEDAFNGSEYGRDVSKTSARAVSD